MKVKFEKWHGCKNDFIVTWLPEIDQLTRQSLKTQAPLVCARDGGGVGADGIVILHPKNKDDLFPRRITIINSDGSLAATCGNGLRCAALSTLKAWRERGNPHESPDGAEFEVLSQDGSVRGVLCRFLSDRKLQPGDRLWPLVSVDMGEIQVGAKVPVRQQAIDLLLSESEKLGVRSKVQTWEVCAVGNLHLVVSSEEASQEMANLLGPSLQKKSEEWDGINLHLIRGRALEATERARMGRLFQDLSDDGYEAWIWERGAGPTQACGSGACAIVAVATSSGDVESDVWVPVHMPGGMLLARFDESEGRATLAGPAELVFEGVLEF